MLNVAFVCNIIYRCNQDCYAKDDVQMKVYKSSDLSHKRAEVLKAARNGGVIIEERRSNGEVMETYELKRVNNENTN